LFESEPFLISSPALKILLSLLLAVFLFENIQDVVIPVLNDLVLNQVLVSFGRDQATQRVIERLQGEGTCWCGGTVHQGHSAMRISVSSWATTLEDCERSLDAIQMAAAKTVEKGTIGILGSCRSQNCHLYFYMKKAP